jgi:hypothetical protein
MGMQGKTLCVQVDAERQSVRSHAERGNDQKKRSEELLAFFRAFTFLTPLSPSARRS